MQDWIRLCSSRCCVLIVSQRLRAVYRHYGWPNAYRAAECLEALEQVPFESDDEDDDDDDDDDGDENDDNDEDDNQGPV